MNNIRKRRDQQNRLDGNNKLLTAKMFLGKENHPAYADSTTILNFVDNERLEDVQQMEDFFALVKERRKFSLNLRERKDTAGKPYVYQNFLSSMGPEGKKVMLIGDIKQFIIDYHRGLITIGFTFEELIEEAERNT